VKTLGKVLYYGFPVVVLLLFVVIMLGGLYIKGPTGAADDIPGLMNTVEEKVKAGDWDNAQGAVDELILAWDDVVKRVQFSAESTTALARLKGYTIAQDKPGALAELEEAREHWEDMAR